MLIPCIVLCFTRLQSATRKYLFMYPQVDRSGLRMSKKISINVICRFKDHLASEGRLYLFLYPLLFLSGEERVWNLSSECKIDKDNFTDFRRLSYRLTKWGRLDPIPQHKCLKPFINMGYLKRQKRFRYILFNILNMLEIGTLSPWLT